MTFYNTSSLSLICTFPLQPLKCLLSLQIDLHFLEFCISEIIQYILFLSGLFQLACFFCTSFMVVHISIDQSFPWRSSILLYRYTIVCLSIHIMMNMWIVSSWGSYKYSCYEYSCTGFFFFMDICFHFSLTGKGGSYSMYMFTILTNCQTSFQNGFYHFTFPSIV